MSASGQACNVAPSNPSCPLGLRLRHAPIKKFHALVEERALESEYRFGPGPVWINGGTRTLYRGRSRSHCGGCTHVYTHVYTHAYTHAYTHVCTHVFTRVDESASYTSGTICMSMHMSMHMSIRMSIVQATHGSGSKPSLWPS